LDEEGNSGVRISPHAPVVACLITELRSGSQDERIVYEDVSWIALCNLR
jgi:hypothetical protein